MLPKGSLIYLTSDGYVDQNNPDRKKLGEKRLLELLQEHSGLSLPEQKSILENTLDDFQQGVDQRDDILVMGVKI